MIYGKEVDLRLYINLKRKNVSAFAMSLAEELKGQKFAFKFISNDQMEKASRSESIVIYTNQENGKFMEEAINQVAKKYPQLVKDCNEGNPFMKKLNAFTRYAPNVTGSFVNEKGQVFSIEKSYNSLLARVLEDCYISSAQEVIAKDEELTKDTGGQIFEKSDKYVQLYPFLSEKHPTELIEQMKIKLGQAMKRNNELDIPLYQKVNSTEAEKEEQIK